MNFFCIENANLVHPRCKRGRAGEIGESRREWLLDKFSFEARRTQRAKNYKVWTDDNHAILLENAKWMQQRLNYIHNNPVRQLIVQHPHEYIFSSAMDYADEKGLVNIVKT
jgi:hypothetical protein